jgi:hypothetical protein
MATPLSQPRTSLVDLPEEDRELTADELPLIVGGGATECGNDADSRQTGHYTCDTPKMN